METLAAIVVFVPGVKELLLFAVLFFFSAARRRSLSVALVPPALLRTGVIFLIVSVLLSLPGGPATPYLYLTYIGVALLAWVCRRLGTRAAAWLALPVAMLWYLVALREFTYVAKTLTVEAPFEIGARGDPEAGNPAERLVTFTFGQGEYTAIYSDALASYLEAREEPKAEVTLNLLYHWGAFAGHDVRAVDGRHFEEKGGSASFSCRELCPRLYFGVRSFSR